MADTATTLSNSALSRLQLARADYAEEIQWHRFLIDAVNGTGGFRGRYAPPAMNLLGWAASTYGYTPTTAGSSTATTTCESYLDKFTREDDERFQRRVNVAHYTNYVGPIHELLMSYVGEENFHRQDEPEEVAEWRKNVDGNGTDWDTMRKDVLQPRASELGWMPVMFDMPAAPEPGKEMSKAEAETLGLNKPIAIPLFPANLLDWMVDQTGEFTEAKVRIDREYRESILHLPGTESTYWIWSRTQVIKYTVRTVEGTAQVADEETIPHRFNCVPIVIFRGKPTPGCKVRGISNIGDLAVEARTHFNLNSELRDHIRGQVFAVLGIPMTDTSKEVGTIVAGNHGALKVPADANIGLHYVAPPASVAETLETSRAVSVKEMHRIARVEYDEKGTGVATSGVARAYQFEKTNKRLATIAGSFARSDQKALRLVGRMMNVAAADETTVISPTDFRVDDLTTDLENVIQAVTLKMGPTAEAELKKRSYRKLAPNTPQKTLDVIDSEIDDVAEQDAQDAALEQEMHKATVDAAKLAAKDPQVTPVPGEEAA